MQTFVFHSELKDYLEKQFKTENIEYEFSTDYQVLANCNEELFDELLLAAYAEKQTEEIGLVHVTKRQLQKPGFVKDALEKYHRHGFVVIDDPRILE